MTEECEAELGTELARCRVAVSVSSINEEISLYICQPFRLFVVGNMIQIVRLFLLRNFNPILRMRDARKPV